MIKIESVEIKKTKKGDDYKALTLEGGAKVNMWNDDPDWESAVEGASLERETEQNGQYTNLVPAGEVASKPTTSVKEDQLSAIWFLLRKVAEKVGVEEEKVEEAIEYPEEDIDPSEIPF